jgi:putative transposase
MIMDNSKFTSVDNTFFRRNLPHWRPPGAAFFITYRLAGTLPTEAISELRKEQECFQKMPREPEYSEDEWSIRIEKKMFAVWDEVLHQNAQIQWLADPRIAEIVRENFYHHAGTEYSLWAYAIMPNHVHILLKPDEIWEKQFMLQEESKVSYKKGALSAITHNMRGYTAYMANKALGRKGSFWNDEIYDHWIRDNKEFQNIIYYIEYNPVKAGLVVNPEDWQFSSAYDRHQRGLGSFDRIA